MRKGFIFSADALLAVAFVMAGLAILAVQFNPTGLEAEQFKINKQEVEWKSIVGFNTGRGFASMGLMDSNEEFGDYSQGYCVELFDYAFDVNESEDCPELLECTGTMFSQKYCGGTG
ncbi:hypothetical protein KJ660_02470 [Candidatus Micrarchaeota archaeon]|nr:hypothetical protein [Candidatus Micrarchaeota archaeon]